MSVQFPVSTEAQKKLGEPGKQKIIGIFGAMKAATKTDAEAADSNQSLLLAPHQDRYMGHAQMNGFLRAIHLAFDAHYPLALSPDDIWLAIAQGFANHVNANAEKFRKQFVAHEGKVNIEIIRNNFRKGLKDNDWPGCFAEFSDKLAEHIGKKRDLLVSKFSTTSPTEKIVSEVVLMDAMKSYFDYDMKTMCGIPSITLLGTTDDWLNIRERAQVLSEFDCKDWIVSLTDVLDQFISASRGNADPKFWNSLYKEGGGSGGPYVTGAINTFFPYTRDYHQNLRPNRNAVDWANNIGHMGGGPSPESFPLGMSKVPFKWIYYDKIHPMWFMGGFLGTSQDPNDGTLRPAMGWGIADRPADE